MIFVTVGTDSHFDRMVRVIDAWVSESGRNDVFAQIGCNGEAPSAMPFARILNPREFKERFMAAKVIIGHAGMGTILSALHHGKPILVMPKKASLGEHRNEHQMATAQHLMRMGKINVAFDELQLRKKLEIIDDLIPKASILPVASGPLVGEIHRFIHESIKASDSSVSRNIAN